MNPPVVVNQFRFATVVLTLCAFSTSTEVQKLAAWVCMASLLYWLLLKTEYAWRARHEMRSDSRFEGDRSIASAALLQVVVVLALLGLTALIPDLRLPHIGSWTVPDQVVLAAVLLAVIVHTSSLIDWYWLRPRRDGIVCPPICQDSNRRRRKLLTRILLVHRTVTTLVFGFCAAVIVYFFLGTVAGWLPSDSFWVGFTNAINAPLSIAVFSLIGYRQGLLDVAKIVGGSHHVEFGDTVSTNLGAERFRGKVFEVSVEGVTVVNLNGDRHLAPLVDSSLVIHQDAEENNFCPRTMSSGEFACGALDEGEKCQFGLHRLARDQGTDVYKPTPKPHTPVSLVRPW